MKNFTPANRPKALLFDLDGTVYEGDHEIQGAGQFIRDCHHSNIRTLFVTNRSNRTQQVVAEALNSYGIECTANDIVSTATATALYLKSGSAYVVGEKALMDALTEKGITITDKNPDYVVVSIDREFTYEKLKTATNLIANGAKYIATNTDPRLKLAGSVVPGTGSIVAAVSAASLTQPTIVGKPERLMVEMSLEICQCDKSEVMIIGDFLDTDIATGNNAGIDSLLLLTGISTLKDLETSPYQPTYIAQDFAELSEAFFGVR